MTDEELGGPLMKMMEDNDCLRTRTCYDTITQLRDYPASHERLQLKSADMLITMYESVVWA